MREQNRQCCDITIRPFEPDVLSTNCHCFLLGIVPLACEELFSAIEKKRAGAKEGEEYQVRTSPKSARKGLILRMPGKDFSQGYQVRTSPKSAR